MSEAEGGCCSGGRCCGNSKPDSKSMDRRDFLKAAAVSAGGLAMLSKGAWGSPQAISDPTALELWKEDLLRPRGERRIYRGDELEHIATPLGGIGAGQVYLSGRGGFEQWQIVNNFNSKAHAAGAFFGIRTQTPGGRTTVRLLQETPLDNVPGVTAVEFSGEYPFAWYRYLDGQLPLDVSLEAFSPFIPLNSKDSALPAAFFRFTLENRHKEAVDTALLFAAPNLVGWDGYASLADGTCADFHSNSNAAEQFDGSLRVDMTAMPGIEPGLSASREVFTNEDRIVRLLRLFRNVSVTHRKSIPAPANAETSVVWLGNLGADMSEPALHEILLAVEQGAGLIVSGDTEGLLACATMAGDSNVEQVVFEDWEAGNYSGWTIEGTCFGDAPATGTLQNQQPVEGWRGKAYVNTYVGGDDNTGRATSRAFEIAHDFIHVQVGGGKNPGQTCVNLRVGADIVRTATGENTERLRAVRWDVSELKGRSGTIEIVDSRQGGWGHVLVGDIVFSNSPTAPFIDSAVAQRCKDALPFTFSSVSTTTQPSEIAPNTIVGTDQHVPVGRHYLFQGFKLKNGAEVLLETTDGTPLVVVGNAGKGRVVVCNGDVLGWVSPGMRKILAGRLLAIGSSTSYEEQTGRDTSSPLYGSMALSVLNAGEGAILSSCAQWRDHSALWQDFAADGRLDGASDTTPANPGDTWNGAVCTSVSLAPGETREILCALTWHFPNRTRDDHYGWGPPPGQYDHRLGNRYNVWFKSAADVMAYLATNHEVLTNDTRRFHKTFYDGSLPRWLLDGISANFASLCSPIFIWIEDGTFGGFEGADSCCPMNCTHVYNYVMTTAYLFPELERNVRESDVLVQMHPERHFIPHRLVLPLSLLRLGDEIGGPHHHALDGELGTLLKTYREWRHFGDESWLRRLWPNLSKVTHHVLTDHDVDGDGVIKGEQPNTYDTHIFGSNTFIGTLYLAALRAMEEMARVMGDAALAEECRDRFSKGRAGYDRVCWNGEYYENIFDAPDATPQTYNENNCYGPGCFSDQLLGQWWAHSLDLGYVLPSEHVRGALQAIFKHNWRPDLSNHSHSQRVFAEGREKGLLTGTWPRGGRPERPILYCDEVWTGIEYHVAATLICEGMVEEGLQVAKGARDRYTGNQRNPFAEIECGHHYARALSSYSMLHATSGYDFDAASGRLTFTPRFGASDHAAFFTASQGWGSLRQVLCENAQDVTIKLEYGQVDLKSVRLRLPDSKPLPSSMSVVQSDVAKTAIGAKEGDYYVVTLDTSTRVELGQALSIALRWT